MVDSKSYSNATCTILHGDCRIALDAVADGTVDMIFADPPYNIGKQFNGSTDRWPSEESYAEWCYSWLEPAIRKLKPSGSMYLMTSTQAMPYLDLWLRNRLTVLSRIVWHYDSSGVQARKYYGSVYEPILFAVRDPRNYVFNSEAIEVEAKTGAVRKLIDYRKETPAPYSTKKVPGNVWYLPRVRYRMPEYEEHPTQKPEALLERMVLASTNPGDLVLDPFAGNFTSCAVASRLGRRAIGIELSEEYVKIGLRRLGIAAEYNGAPLTPPVKTFTRKAEPSTSTLHSQSGLFDDQG